MMHRARSCISAYVASAKPAAEPAFVVPATRAPGSAAQSMWLPSGRRGGRARLCAAVRSGICQGAVA